MKTTAIEFINGVAVCRGDYENCVFFKECLCYECLSSSVEHCRHCEGLDEHCVLGYRGAPIAGSMGTWAIYETKE
ncbi:MAG: hypothetical protein ABFC56_07445, partial [Clostridiaceae bacterium]